MQERDIYGEILRREVNRRRFEAWCDRALLIVSVGFAVTVLANLWQALL